MKSKHHMITRSTMIKTNLKYFLPAILLVSLLSILFYNQNVSNANSKVVNQHSVFDSWQSVQNLKLTVHTDLAAILDNKTREFSQDATISWSDEVSNAKSLDAQISPRGKTRLSICEFPPLKLKFDQDQLEASGLAPYQSFKLVTHCNNDQQLVLKEYLTYKMYNELTENSFQVKLAEVTYQDNKGQIDPITQYAIVLENKNEMADRLGGHQMKTKADKLKTIDADQYRMLTVFQYMIGNTDWNLSKGHNIKLIQPNAPKAAPIPVPYDFDYAGIVDAPYAQPHPQLPIQKVTQRLFQWRGKNAEGFESTLALFQDKKQDLYALCQSLPGIEDQEKMEMINYLASFYEIIDQVDKDVDLMAAIQKKEVGLDS